MSYYSFESRVRYSEIGENGKLTLPGILNYFQDCCTFQSASVGQGIEAVAKRNRVWVLSSWQVIVNRYPGMGEYIMTGTAPYDFKGFMGARNFTMDTKDGERLAYANTNWTNINLETGHPERLTEADIEGYVLEPKLEMDYVPRKIALPENMEKEASIVVQKHHLDTNHHVNNCQYVCMAAEYLPENFVIRQMRAEYKKQAVQNDVLYPAVSREEGKVVVALNDENGVPYSVTEFTRS